MADETTGGGGLPDLTSLSKDELRERLKGLAEEEERAVSYRRRVLQGRIDLMGGAL